MKWENKHTLILILILFGISIWTIYKMPVKLGLDLKGGSHLVLECKDTKKVKVNSEVVRGVISVIESRINALGVTEPIIQPKGKRQIVVEIPGIKDPDRAIKIIGDMAQLEFKEGEFVRGEIPKIEEIKKKYGEEAEIGYFDSGDGTAPIPIILKRTVLTGEDLVDARPGLDQRQRLAVDLTFNAKGADKFTKITRKMVSDWTSIYGRPPGEGEGHPLVIMLDKKIISAPHVATVITGRNAQIVGNFTKEEVRDLSIKLKAGALPAPVEVVENRTIGATLGQDSVEKSIKAGIIGIAAILIFMLIYYRLPGLLADIALILYAIFVFAIFKGIPVTLTLPGIAGFILSIGMAVDANILIFERLKEELRQGRTLKSAIDAGFNRAFTSIFDSNICTIITCIILYYFGTGMIRGFALTLGIGVIVSFFTAVTVTRTFLHLIVNLEWTHKPFLFGVTSSEPFMLRKKFNIIGSRNFYFALSGIVIIIGLIFLFPPSNFSKFPPSVGLKKGIDFTGGTYIQIKFKKDIMVGQARRILADFGLEKSIIQKLGKNEILIRTRPLSSNMQKKIEDAFKDFSGKIEKFESVGPTIGRELTNKAIYSIIWASILIIIYLGFRFNQIKFGICAVIALIHDTIVVTGSFAVLGKLLNVEVDSLFVTAVLTIIGFSVHDTIVIFDRIRENLKHKKPLETFEEVTNYSILQTFTRSVNTSLTVLFTIVALLIWGGPVIRYFNLALLIGIISGTYSSIFNAAPLLVVWENFARRKREDKVLIPKKEEKALLIPKTQIKPNPPSSQSSPSTSREKKEKKKKKKKKGRRM
jgi:SecD/SecF fusion protein